MTKGDNGKMELGNMLFGRGSKERCGKYHIDRNAFQDLFCKWLVANGFDEYGNLGSGGTEVMFTESNGDWYFENEVFVLRPYYWGEDENIVEKPYFLYKQTGLQITWYKYPLRDAYSNKKLELESFKAMLADCTVSLGVPRERG